MKRSELGVAVFVCAFGVAAASGQDGPQFLISDAGGNKVVRFDYPSGQAVDHFVGVGLSPLDNGIDMTYGPDGNLYVVSFDNNSVQRYHGQTGRFLGTFVTSGSGGLARPVGLAFGPDGNLYVGSRDNDRVLRYDGTTGAPMGIFVQPAAGGLDGPYSLAFGPDGDLYVASYFNNSVLAFDGSTGAFRRVVVPTGTLGLVNPWGLVFDAAGRLYVGGFTSDNVIVVPPGGTPLPLVAAASGGLNEPRQLAIGPDGALVVVANSTGVSALRYNATTGQLIGTLLVAGAGGISGENGVVFVPQPPAECRADFDGDGSLTIFDFLAFQNAFDLGCP